MDKEWKHEKKQRITLGDLIIRKDPKGGFGLVIHTRDTTYKHTPAPPAEDESPEPPADD